MGKATLAVKFACLPWSGETPGEGMGCGLWGRLLGTLARGKLRFCDNHLPLARERVVSAASSPPEQGQLVTVRQRQYVVTDVAKSTLPDQPLRASGNGAQHLVSLASIEDDALGEELQVIWELEPGARTIEKVALPRPNR
jgi:hypothetical protein